MLEYPFPIPGQPRVLRGRAEIRAYHEATEGRRSLVDIDGVEAVAWQTDDPEVVVTEIEHHGRSVATGAAYRFRALGVIRVRNGEIVHYADYMNPIAIAEILGRVPDLVAALTAR